MNIIIETDLSGDPDDFFCQLLFNPGRSRYSPAKFITRQHAVNSWCPFCTHNQADIIQINRFNEYLPNPVQAINPACIPEHILKIALQHCNG